VGCHKDKNTGEHRLSIRTTLFDSQPTLQNTLVTSAKLEHGERSVVRQTNFQGKTGVHMSEAHRSIKGNQFVDELAEQL
jgi:hypothetical protein